MSEEVIVAIDVGGTSARGALYSRSGQVSQLERRETQGYESEAELVEAIVELADGLVNTGRSRYGSKAVCGVGLVVAGLVDEDQGVAVSSMMLGWHRVHFVQLIADRTGLPVGFGHDVRVAARAEGVLGAARGYGDYLFVSLGTGVGSSMVLDGKAYVGANGVGGELAHFVVEPEGPPCRCGKFGCLEMVASAEAVARRYRELQSKEEEISARDVVDQVHLGERAALGVWNRALAALGKGIATYIEFLDPALVVVGGGMSEAGEMLFEPLGEIVGASVSRPDTAAPIIPAGLGHLAGVHGAALLAWEQVDGSLEEITAHWQGSCKPVRVKQ